jgi:hypothetical protein
MVWWFLLLFFFVHIVVSPIGGGAGVARRRVHFLYLPKENATKRKGTPIRRFAFSKIPSLRNNLGGRRDVTSCPDTPQLAVHGQLTPKITPALSDSQGIGKSTAKSKSRKYSRECEAEPSCF